MPSVRDRASFAEDAPRVDTRFVRAESSIEEDIARFILGCDGMQCTVREGARIGMAEDALLGHSISTFAMFQLRAVYDKAD
jgi:hypothetical protein